MQPPLEALAEESKQRTHHVEKSCAALEGVPQTAHQVCLSTAGQCFCLESWGSMHPHDAVDAPSKQPGEANRGAMGRKTRWGEAVDNIGATSGGIGQYRADPVGCPGDCGGER